MQRKLIQLSPSTSVVSLPSKWIKKNKLTKGDDINLHEVENKIILSNDKAKTENKITIDVKNLGERIVWAHIDAAYIAGYDEITFLIKGKEQYEIMGHAADEVPGMMIFSHTREKAVFKDITGSNKEDVNKILNRIFNLNISLIDDSIKAINEKDWIVLKKIKKRDYRINSYTSYCLRQINKFGYSTFSKTGLMTTYLKVLEMLSDKLCDLMLIIESGKIVNENKVLELLLDVYRKIQRVHENYNQNKINELNLLRQKLKTKNKKLELKIDEIKSLLFDLFEVEIQFQL